MVNVNYMLFMAVIKVTHSWRWIPKVIIMSTPEYSDENHCTKSYADIALEKFSAN